MNVGNGSTLTVNGSLAGNNAVGVFGTANFNSTNSLTGSDALTVNTGGTAILTSANNTTGATAITGTLQLQNASSLASSALTLNSGATLQLRSDSNTTFTPTSITAVPSNGTVNFDVNNITGGTTGKTLTLSGGLTFAGTGTTTFNISGGNGYTLALGAMTLSNGTLAISAGTGSSLTVASASGSGGNGGSAISVNGAGNVEFTGALTTNTGKQLTLTVGTVGGTTGTTKLSGANSFHGTNGGGVNLNSGTLALNNTAAFNNVGNLNIAGGTLDALVSGVTSSNPIQTWSGDFAFTGTQNLNLGTGAVTLSGATRQVTVNGSNLTVGGVIADGGSGFGLTKAGTGTLTLNGVSTYSGPTTISNGTLIVGDATHSTASLGSGSAVAINSGGTLGGAGTVSGTVSVNNGGTLSPGNSPGTINTGATTYNSGGTYLWQVNNATGTKGGSSGYDWQNIAGTLNIASTNTSTFGINVQGLTAGNVQGVVPNWNPTGFSQFTLATASGGITNYSSDKFGITTSTFTNNNSLGNGGFSVQQSGNNLLLVFNPAGGGTGANGLVKGLGVFASDNASQTYTNANLNGQTGVGGFGYGAWTANNVSGFAGSFIGDAKVNAGGNSGNFINTTGGNSFGLFANTQNTATAGRTITNGLSIGQTFSLDFDNGYSNAGNKGFVMSNGSGNALVTFQLTGNTGNYQLIDNTGTHTILSGFTGSGMHTEFTQTAGGSYTFTISGPGFTTQTFSGTLLNPAGGQGITQFQAFNGNGLGGAGPADSGGDYNVYINSPLVLLPTWNGSSVGAGGGNFSNGANWAAHTPVNGGSLAFDGTGSTVNNDNLTSVYNLAFNATATNAGGGTGNNTTNAGAYTLTGNALTINGGIDNNSTSLQTINNNLTLGASQTFNATNGGVTVGGTVALGGNYLTVNAANAVALNGNITGNGDILKTGGGTLTLGGANSFTGTAVSGQTYGQVFITNGTVRAASNSALGTQVGGVSVDLGDSNLGQTGVTNYQNNVSLLANSNLTIANQLYIANNTVGGGNATRTVGSDGTTGPVTFSGNVLLAGSAILTAASGGNVTFSGTVGTTGFTAGGITKTGAGTVLLTNANGFTGSTTINNGTLSAAAAGALGSTSGITVNTTGTLLLGASSAIGSGVGVTLAGGTFKDSGFSQGSGATVTAGVVTGSTVPSLGTLTLSSASTLDFGTSGNGTLVFSGLSGSANLSIVNWANTDFNTAANNSGLASDDRLIFMSDPAAFLGQISFGGRAAGEINLGSGNGWEVGAVPEPSTVFAALALVGFMGYRERRRLKALAGRFISSMSAA